MMISEVDRIGGKSDLRRNLIQFRITTHKECKKFGEALLKRELEHLEKHTVRSDEGLLK